MSLWWLSFVDKAKDECLGVAVVNAPSFLTAVLVSHHLGINPGGEVAGWGPFRPDSLSTAFWDRLLDPETARALVLHEATGDESVFDFYSDVPREPCAESHEDCPAATGLQAVSEDRGEGDPILLCECCNFHESTGP